MGGRTCKCFCRPGRGSQMPRRLLVRPVLVPILLCIPIQLICSRVPLRLFLLLPLLQPSFDKFNLHRVHLLDTRRLFQVISQPILVIMVNCICPISPFCHTTARLDSLCIMCLGLLLVDCLLGAQSACGVYRSVFTSTRRSRVLTMVRHGSRSPSINANLSASIA